MVISPQRVVQAVVIHVIDDAGVQQFIAEFLVLFPSLRLHAVILRLQRRLLEVVVVLHVLQVLDLPVVEHVVEVELRVGPAVFEVENFHFQCGLNFAVVVFFLIFYVIFELF